MFILNILTCKRGVSDDVRPSLLSLLYTSVQKRRYERFCSFVLEQDFRLKRTVAVRTIALRGCALYTSASLKTNGECVWGRP